MSDTTTSFPRVGETFQERYRLDQVIGQGGYARVYRARQTDLGRDVAIKILRTQDRTAAKIEEAGRRFEREAKLVSQLHDPHTITMYDYGRTSSGALYMVTEFVDGTNLLDFVNGEGALAPGRAAQMVLGVLYSLQEAHERGILHRDIKPANVMVYALPGRPDQVKLLDFGIAKAFEQEADDGDSMAMALTAQGRVVGSPGYMSPEQIRGDALTPASDVYSTGLVFYEMLSGRRAIDTDDLRAAFRQIDEVPILLPEELDIPPRLRAIVERMVDKHVDRRYPSALEVIDELAEFVSPATNPHPAHNPTPTTDTETRVQASSPAAVPAAADAAAAVRRYQMLAIVAVVVAAIAAAAYVSTSL